MKTKKKATPKTSKTKRTKASKTPVAKATTAAILGISPESIAKKSPSKKRALPDDKALSIKPKWKKYYLALAELHDRLLKQMDGLAKESAEQVEGYSLHMADSGTDNFDRDFALSLLSSDQDAVYEIEEALKRIEKGTFGNCELTGKPIPKDRLDAIPWARFTVEAQAQLEKDGTLRHPRLGALGSVDSTGGSVASGLDEGDASANKSQTNKE